MPKRKRPALLCLHQEKPPGGQKAAVGDEGVTSTGLIQDLLPLRSKEGLTSQNCPVPQDSSH